MDPAWVLFSPVSYRWPSIECSKVERILETKFSSSNQFVLRQLCSWTTTKTSSPSEVQLVAFSRFPDGNVDDVEELIACWIDFLLKFHWLSNVFPNLNWKTVCFCMHIRSDHSKNSNLRRRYCHPRQLKCCLRWSLELAASCVCSKLQVLKSYRQLWCGRKAEKKWFWGTRWILGGIKKWHLENSCDEGS